MAMNAGTAFLSLQLRGKKKVKSDLTAINGRLKKFGSTIKNVAAALATAFVVRKTGDFLSQAIQNASKMQETMNKFNVVFGSASGDMKTFSDEMAAGFGRSKEQVASFLSSAQDLLVPMGIGKDAATGMSKGMSALAMDLASFNNAADADVMNDLQAALTGSGEVMKKYGVIVSESTLKQELMNMGLDPTRANDAQKAMARYNLILEGTKAAQGDVARSSESFANQTKSVGAQFNDLLTTIGEAMLPIMEDWLMDLQAAFSLLGDLGSESDSTGGSFSFLTDIMKAMISPVELLIRGWKMLGGIWSAAQSLVSELAEKVVWLAEKMVWLAAKAQRLAEDMGVGWVTGMDADNLEDTVASLKAQRDAIDKLGKKQWDDSAKQFGEAFGPDIRKRLDKARTDVKKTREKANVDLKKLTKEDIAKQGTATTKEVKQGGRIESLEATSAAAFNKFFQVKQDLELDELKKQTKILQAAPIVRAAVAGVGGR